MKTLFSALLMALATQSVFAATIRTTDGNVISGTVTTTGLTEIVVSTEYGAIRIPTHRLTDETRSQLGITSNDPAALQAQVASLKAENTRLRDENRALRERLSTPSPVAPIQTAPRSSLSSGVANQEQSQSGGFWISNTGKRHNSGCRWFRTSAGRDGSANEGSPCKVCGG